jgi:hypothetical protein
MRRSLLTSFLLAWGKSTLCEDSLPAALEALRRLSDSSPTPPAVDWNAPWSASVDASGSVAQQQQPSPQTQQQHPETVSVQAKSAMAEQTKVPLPTSCRPSPVTDSAVVTLISSNEGYPAGALALSASLEVLGSKLRRIALVTPTVNQGIRDLLRGGAWEVREVAEVACNQVLGPQVTPDRYDLGDEYRAKMRKWRSTCTKFHAWDLTFLNKVIFLDADTLVLGPIDSLADHPSAFAAAPDTYAA